MPLLKLTENGVTREISFVAPCRLSEILQKNHASLDHPCGGKGTCKKCAVTVNGKEELSCRYILEGDAEVIIGEEKAIRSLSGASESGVLDGEACLCLDIGTTTLALALVSLKSGSAVKVITDVNPQRSYGADVMSRIEYCSKNQISELQDSLLSSVNQMVEELLSEFGLKCVKTLFVSGNTTMLHTFFGIDCSSMGVSPYTPSFLDSKTVKGDLVDKADEIISLPGIAAFVGADIVAGMNFVGFPSEGRYSLLVDLGTNAEIALWNREKAICTAAAAGPCFEGANISSGMSASLGALCVYRDDQSYETIGNTPVKGICATGLIDIIATLVKKEIIDETGYMEEDLEIGNSVSLTQGDVREFQLAKSAISAAIACLIDRAGISYDEVEKLYVAGGFSAQLNVENAASIGLIPSELADKVIPINNSSLLGTIKYAAERNDLDEFISISSYADISSDKLFSELFFENMMF